MNVEDIINLISRRDNISYIEAMNVVNDCMEEMEGAIMRGNWQEAEDILASYLSLEPDYLDILMAEMFKYEENFNFNFNFLICSHINWLCFKENCS